MQNTNLTPISEIIGSTFPPNVAFKANPDFYKNIGINKHRFSKIFKGEIEPNRIEINSIAKYFNIPANKFF